MDPLLLLLLLLRCRRSSERMRWMQRIYNPFEQTVNTMKQKPPLLQQQQKQPQLLLLWEKQKNEAVTADLKRRSDLQWMNWIYYFSVVVVERDVAAIAFSERIQEWKSNVNVIAINNFDLQWVNWIVFVSVCDFYFVVAVVVHEPNEEGVQWQLNWKLNSKIVLVVKDRVIQQQPFVSSSSSESRYHHRRRHDDRLIAAVVVVVAVVKWRTR
jgi:hypothetical protein